MPATKKKNDDDLSAAVESSSAVQTLHDTSIDIEKLIDQVSRLSVGEDPLVVDEYRQHGAKTRGTRGKQCRRRCWPAPLQTSSD
jgi:hypothetical protein